MKSRLLATLLVLSLVISLVGFIGQISAILEKKHHIFRERPEVSKDNDSKENLPTSDGSSSTAKPESHKSAESRLALSFPVSQAYAQSGKSPKKDEISDEKKLSDKPAPGASPDAKSSQTVTQKDCAGFLESKILELNERERILAEKEALLKALQKDIEDKLARLEEIQRNIEAFKKEQERLKNEKIDSLVKIYGSMKPKEASKLLEKLDDDLVVSIISRMTTDQAAKIIANMDVKKAAEISQKLSKIKSSTSP